jgi:hypothetical protein
LKNALTPLSLKAANSRNGGFGAGAQKTIKVYEIITRHEHPAGKPQMFMLCGLEIDVEKRPEFSMKRRIQGTI